MPKSPNATPDAPTPPAEQFGLKPAIRSAAHVAAAVAWIVWLRLRRSTVEAERDAELAAVRERHAARLTVDVDGTSVPMQEREAALLESVRKYCSKHPGRVFPDGKKSVDLDAGHLSMRSETIAAEFRSGENKKTVLARIDKKHGLSAKLAKLKESEKLQFVKLKPELDVAAVNAAIKAGTISDKELAALGLKRTAPRESVTIKGRS